MRRHKALQAKPNPGHYALTELAKKVPDFINLTQNVDGRLNSHLLNSTRQVTCGYLEWFPLFFLSR
jgi:NAD-dependent SIR2 family protein deacetylase